MSPRSIFPVSVDALTKSLSFLEERHRIISNNIANSDTPGFKAQAAPMGEFQKALAGAIEARRANPAAEFRLERTAHVREGRRGLEVVPVTAAGDAAGILRHDGNNVSLDREMANLAENTLLYRTMSDLLRKQFQMLQSAIQERAS